MPVRKDYPIPTCPKCGKRDSRVLNTYYTEDEDIIRLRECNFCTHRLYTQQPPEQFLDPDVYRVVIPKFSDTKRKRVAVRHKSVDTHYREKRARANDQSDAARRHQLIENSKQPPTVHRTLKLKLIVSSPQLAISPLRSHQWHLHRAMGNL